MAGKDPKKGKEKIKIDDLKQKPLTAKEEDLTKGGLMTGGLTKIGPIYGTTTPRVDRTFTDPDDVD